jgi:hypothetical protein
LDNLSADEVPLETCFQLATLRDEDSELKRLAIFLLAKGTLSIKLRAAAEEKLFMLERREDTEDDVRYHALKMLLFLSRSPNTALRDSTRFLKSAESTAELLEALSLDLFTASVELSQFSTDSAANCILAALAEDLSAERRAALLNALHPLKTHDKSFDSLCPQTRADIQEVAESYFSDDRNSAPLRLNAASLMYVDLGVSDSATLAAQRIVADDKSNPRLVSFAKRLLERVKRQKMATDPK